jgi:hypothetical protein
VFPGISSHVPLPRGLSVDARAAMRHHASMNDSRRRRLLSILAFFILLGTGSAAFAAPFDNMLARLEKALALLETADAPTSYVILTTLEIADGGKKTLQTTELRERVTLAPGQPIRRETLSRKTVGEMPDATSGASKKSENGGSASWTVVFPVGKDRPSFRFSPERKEGSLMAADFSPVASAGTAEGLTRGTLFWDPATEIPSRLEAVPVRNPPFTSELSFSFTFASAGGISYPASASFSAEGGVLFFRRRIQSVSRITEFSRKP